jgi:hypothetical protein
VVITTTDFASWTRIVEAVKPQWVAVSSDRQWFRNGYGIVYQWVKEGTAP